MSLLEILIVAMILLGCFAAIRIEFLLEDIKRKIPNSETPSQPEPSSGTTNIPPSSQPERHKPSE